MDIIDNYRTTTSRYKLSIRSKPSLSLSDATARTNEEGLPKYLLKMRDDVYKRYPTAYVSIFSNENN